jgi:hypothetical protein
MALPTESTLLAEFTYILRPVERGYANRTLYINLDTNTIEEKPVTQQMKDLFTGGRGFGLKLLWDAVKPDLTPEPASLSMDRNMKTLRVSARTSAISMHKKCWSSTSIAIPMASIRSPFRTALPSRWNATRKAF